MSNNSIKNLIKSNSKRISKTHILCIGDLILDQYIYGNVERMSPEAPVPILSINEENFQLGGVGNVARNISSLGGNVSLLTLIGNDKAGETVRLMLKECNVNWIKTNIFSEVTIRKTRFIANQQHLLRHDPSSG